MSEEVLFGREPDEPVEGVTAEQAESDKYLIFKSAGILFGVNAALVVEIVTEASITFVPMLPAYIRGVVNLRGLMVPIIDFRTLVNKGYTENSCTIVLRDGEAQLGVLVDGVEQMVDIERKSVLPVPQQSSSGIQELVNGMVSLADGSGVMMVLDCGVIFDRQTY